MKHKVKFRQNVIKELINKNEIEDQDSLVVLMEQEYNITTNQSAISRDLRALGVVKRIINNKNIYEIDTTDPSKEILRLAVIDIQHNESVIVIHTLPGLPAFVADYIDMQSHLDILGTMSGENTLIAIPKSTKNISHSFKSLCKLLYVKKTTSSTKV